MAAVLDAVQELDHVGASPAGYWGMSMGCAPRPFIAAEPRIRAAVLGLRGGDLAEAAATDHRPVEFLCSGT